MITIDDICPEIKSNNPIERAMAVCMASDSKDPVKILRKLMSDPDIPFHGPVHHSLVPFAMLTAYKNSGGDIDLEDTIKTAHKRFNNTCGRLWALGLMRCGLGMWDSIQHHHRGRPVGQGEIGRASCRERV